MRPETSCRHTARTTRRPTATSAGHSSTASTMRPTGSTCWPPSTVPPTALWIVDDNGDETKLTFAEVVLLSQRLASYLDANGVERGDRVLLLLGNVAPLWVAMLACIRLGAVMIPATTMLSSSDLDDRISRGNVRAVVAAAADTGKFDAVEGIEDLVKVSVGSAPEGWLAYDDGVADGVEPLIGGDTAADDTLLLYFTSGTTAQPKLVEHTHTSYPLGHLSTMYWIGLQPGDLHLNISSPGWAKHAWSCFFAPWNAGATIVIHNYARFDAERLLDDDGAGRRDDVLRAADGLADARRRRSWARTGWRCGNASAPASRSTPRSSSRSRSHGASRSGTASARPRPRHRSATPPASRSSSARWGARCRDTSSSLVDPVTGEVGDRRRDLPGARPSAAGPDAGLPRRRQPYRRGDARRFLPHRRRRRRSTRTATSPTSAGPTTCSRRATTGSARSSWRAC